MVGISRLWKAVHMLRRMWEIGECEQSPANVYIRQIARRLYTIAGDCSQSAWYLANVGNTCNFLFLFHIRRLMWHVLSSFLHSPNGLGVYLKLVHKTINLVNFYSFLLSWERSKARSSIHISIFSNLNFHILFDEWIWQVRRQKRSEMEKYCCEFRKLLKWLILSVNFVEFDRI